MLTRNLLAVLVACTFTVTAFGQAQPSAPAQDAAKPGDTTQPVPEKKKKKKKDSKFKGGKHNRGSSRV